MSIGSLAAGPALAAHLEAAEARDKAETPPDLRARAVLVLSRAETAALTQDVLDGTGDQTMFVADREYRVADASGDAIVLEAVPAPTPRPLSPDQQQTLDGYNEDGGFTLAGVIEASFHYDADTETYTVRIEPQENVRLEEPSEVTGATIPEYKLALAMSGRMTNPVFGNLLEDLGLNVPGVGGYGPNTVVMRALRDASPDAPAQADQLVALFGAEKAEEIRTELSVCLAEYNEVADELREMGETEEAEEIVWTGEIDCAEGQELDIQIALNQRFKELRARRVAAEARIAELKDRAAESLANMERLRARTVELKADSAELDEINAELTRLMIDRAICELQGKPASECSAMDARIDKLQARGMAILERANPTPPSADVTERAPAGDAEKDA